MSRGGATVSGQALIDGCGKSPRVEARIGAQSLEVAELLAGTAVADLIDGKLDVDTAVKDRGRSVRALMAGLDGFGKTLDKEFGQEKP